MLRTIVFAAATTLGLTLPLAQTSTAQAHPPVVVYSYPSPPAVVYSYPPPPVVYTLPATVVYAGPAYVVSYYGGHHRWYYYATYASRCDADRAAHHLRYDGFAVRIEIR